MLATVLSTTERDVEDRLSSVAGCECVIVRDPGREGVWRFISRILTDMLGEGLDAGERRIRALALGDALSRRHPEESLTLARLYREAGDKEGGMKWGRKALDSAAEMSSVEDAMTALSQVHGVMGDDEAFPDDIARMALLAAERMKHMGNPDDARRLLEELLLRVPKGPLRMRATAELSGVLVSLDRKKARDLALSLIAETRGGDAGPLKGALAEAMLTIIRVAFFEGDYASAMDASRNLLKEMDGRVAAENAEKVILAYYWLSWSLLEQNLLDEAWAEYRRALALALDRDDARLHMHLLNLEGEIFSAQGDWAQSVRAYEEAVVLERRLGRFQDMVIDLANLSGAKLEAGDIEGARRNADEALVLSRRLSLARPGALARIVKGRITISEGRPEDAVVLAREALSYAAKVGIPWLQGAGSILLAEGLSLTGHDMDASRVLASMAGEAGKLKVEDRIRMRIISPALVRS